MACRHRPAPLFAPVGGQKVYRLGVWCIRCWAELPLGRFEEGLRELGRRGVSPGHLDLLRADLARRA